MVWVKIAAVFHKNTGFIAKNGKTEHLLLVYHILLKLLIVYNSFYLL